ncbi:MAG: cytochrome b561 [Phenylobacterium sp.]|jgi:cytochrome b561
MTTLTNQSAHQPAEGPAKHYDRGYKWLHWSMAILVLLMLLALIGFAQEMTTEEYKTILTGHSSIGTVISLLLIMRMSKRFIKRDPRPAQNIAQWQQRASKMVQLGLYFCMVFIPLTGYLSARFHQLPVKVFGYFDLNHSAQQAYQQQTFELVRGAHEFGIKLLMVLLVVHIGAVIYHRLIKKDDVLASMVKSNKKS